LKKSTLSDLSGIRIARIGLVPAFFFSFLLFAKGVRVLLPIVFISFSDFVHPDSQESGQNLHCQHKRLLYCNQLFFDVDAAPPRVEVAG
jgi:hypothetical protein